MGIMDDIAEDITKDWPGDWPGDWNAALAALAWQQDLGVIDALEDAPVDRYALTDAPTAAPRDARRADPARPVVAEHAAPQDAPAENPLAVARTLADGANSLQDLEEAVGAFEHCELKQGARRTILGGGHATARVMIFGDAPSRQDEVEVRPFAGEAGRLLDRMIGAIGLSRDAPDAQAAVRLAYLVPWRPPGNGALDPGDVEMMLVFAARHVALVDPSVIVVMGPACAAALTGARGLRGKWAEAFGRPALTMAHPDLLLRTPLAKREAWADLLTLRDRLALG